MTYARASVLWVPVVPSGVRGQEMTYRTRRPQAGMTRVFTDAGETVPVTVIEVLPNVAVGGLQGPHNPSGPRALGHLRSHGSQNPITVTGTVSPASVKHARQCRLRPTSPIVISCPLHGPRAPPAPKARGFG